MPYIPKSKYKVSTTSGGEFMYAQSRKEYTGLYMILSNNLLLAGSSPNDIKASSLLIPLEETKKDNTYLIMEVNEKGGSVDYFNVLNEGVFKKHDSYEPIITTKPSPTKEDYVKGFFYRYIVKRRNSDSHYYEVGKETHKSITNEEGRYDDYLHKSIKMKWS